MRRFYEAVKSDLHCNEFCTKSKMPVVTTTVKFPSMWRGDGDDQNWNYLVLHTIEQFEHVERTLNVLPCKLNPSFVQRTPKSNVTFFASLIAINIISISISIHPPYCSIIRHDFLLHKPQSPARGRNYISGFPNEV